MKKIIFVTTCLCFFFFTQAQILRPVTWAIQLIDSDTAEKEIRFTATAAEGWHVYDMNLPKGGPVSTSFIFETKQGLELIGTPEASVAPTTVQDEMFKMELRWYAGTVVFTQHIKVTDPAKFKLTGEVEYMACNDETCLAPQKASFSFDRNHISLTTSAITDVDDENEFDETEDPFSPAFPVSPVSPVSPASSASPVSPVSPALWLPVIDELKAFGDTTVSAPSAS